MTANEKQYGNENDKQLHAATVDFGDGALALVIDGTEAADPTFGTAAFDTAAVDTNTAAPSTNKALCAFGLAFTIIGQTALALAIAAGGDPFIGTTGAIGIAGFGLGFAFAGTAPKK